MVGPSPKLVLSSASKRRLELLSQVGHDVLDLFLDLHIQ